MWTESEQALRGILELASEQADENALHILFLECGERARIKIFEDMHFVPIDNAGRYADLGYKYGAEGIFVYAQKMFVVILNQKLGPDIVMVRDELSHWSLTSTLTELESKYD